MIQAKRMGHATFETPYLERQIDYFLRKWRTSVISARGLGTAIGRRSRKCGAARATSGARGRHQSTSGKGISQRPGVGRKCNGISLYFNLVDGPLASQNQSSTRAMRDITGNLTSLLGGPDELAMTQWG